MYLLELRNFRREAVRLRVQQETIRFERLAEYLFSVAVGPHRSMARAYSLHTGSSTGWSWVSSVYFSNFECPAM